MLGEGIWTGEGSLIADATESRQDDLVHVWEGKRAVKLSKELNNHNVSALSLLTTQTNEKAVDVLSAYPWSQTALKRFYHLERPSNLEYHGKPIVDGDKTFFFEGATYLQQSSADSFSALIATGQSENPLTLHYRD